MLIKPMLAIASPPIDSDKHIFEIKWDGTRCIAFIDKAGVRLQNRRLLDITYRYPEFHGLNKYLKAKSAVFDGEIVVLEEGMPKFDKLQQREHTDDPHKIKILSGLMPAIYIAFDLLYVNGKSVISRPLIKRREMLRKLFPIAENVIFSETYEDGIRLFQEAIKMGFEGIMAKEKESPYLPGERSNYWLKIKKTLDIDAIVCGYLEGEGERKKYFGSLILGIYDKGKLIHIGQVGTGIDEDTMKNLHKKLTKLKTDASSFDISLDLKRRVFWCKPELVVRVSYQEWTKDNKLRVPVFKAIRDDKSPEECVL